jgi:hypothetical protein
MGNTITKKELEDNKIIDGRCMIQTPTICMNIYEDENGNFYIYHTGFIMEKILFIEKISESCLFIGIYNDFCKQYAKHTLIKTNDGFIWEYTHHDLNLTLRELELRHTCDIISEQNLITEFKETKSEMVNKLGHFIFS